MAKPPAMIRRWADDPYCSTCRLDQAARPNPPTTTGMTAQGDDPELPDDSVSRHHMAPTTNPIGPTSIGVRP